MARNRQVSIDLHRLELSDGDWIEVKTELAYGEQLELQDAAMVIYEGLRVRQEMARYHIKRMELYIVEWSLKDKQGKLIPLTADGIRMLRLDDAKEINDALDAHIDRMHELMSLVNAPNGHVDDEDVEQPKNRRSASKRGA